MHTARRSRPLPPLSCTWIPACAGMTYRGEALRVSVTRTRLRSNVLGLMHHEECAFFHAHGGLSADQLVVEPEGISWLQAGLLQRIFHTSRVTPVAGPE